MSTYTSNISADNNHDIFRAKRHTHKSAPCAAAPGNGDTIIVEKISVLIVFDMNSNKGI